MGYTNGKLPLTVVSVVLGSGYDSKGRYWEHRLTPATAARWAHAVQYALTKWGKRIRIRAGANGYRDIGWQQIARTDACAAGNCNGASVVGWSSHGGNWRGRDCLAIDVDPNGLTWAQVWEACRAAGFECGLITQEISGIPGGEPWHIIDFNAFGPIPAGMDATPFTPTQLLEESMSNPIVNVVDIPGREAKYGTIYIGRDDGTFEPLGAPFAPNIRGILSVVFLGGKGDDDLSRVTVVQSDFNAIKPIWATMCKGRTDALTVWGHRIQAQDANGKGVTDANGLPVAYSAEGYLASTNAQVGGTVADVDEVELAEQLAPLLTATLPKLSDEDVQRLAEAAADEQDRRERERLG